MPRPAIATAASERRLRDPAIFFVNSEELLRRFRSARSASASRIAAYWEMIAKIPVAATTTSVKYFVACEAFANLPKAANTNTPIKTRLGAT